MEVGWCVVGGDREDDLFFNGNEPEGLGWGWVKGAMRSWKGWGRRGEERRGERRVSVSGRGLEE